jgi:hypothetical protein
VKRLHRAGALAASASVLAAGVALAAPAAADDSSDAFLAALNRANIPYADNNADLTAQLGERVCPMLVEPGKNFAQVATTVADNGINPGLAAFFTGIAISMYCPQMMGSIGNGTFLNMLQDNQGLSGLVRGAPGVPGVPGLPVR